MPLLPCPCCGTGLEQRTTKRFKPYFLCELCGVQLFVRKKYGIERLEEFFRNIEKARIPYTLRAQHFHEIQAIIREIHDLSSEIDKIGISYLFNNDKMRVRKLLQAQVDNLFSQLKQITNRKS